MDTTPEQFITTTLPLLIGGCRQQQDGFGYGPWCVEHDSMWDEETGRCNRYADSTGLALSLLTAWQARDGR